jgi:hypothetical protein
VWVGESERGRPKRSTPRDAPGAGVMRFSEHAFLFRGGVVAVPGAFDELECL